MHISINLKMVIMLILMTTLASACITEQEPLILGGKITDQKNIRVLYAGVEANVDSIRHAAENMKLKQVLKSLWIRIPCLL